VKPTLRLRRTPRNPNAEMPILEHLAELRSRLVKSMLALLVGTTVAWFVLYDPALDIVTRLYCEGVPASNRGAFQVNGECKLAILSPIDPLNIRIRASLVLGLVIALPIIAYQIWRFIAPGLKTKEKRYAIPFALVTTLLFALGVAMAAFTMPKAINFLTTIGGDDQDDHRDRDHEHCRAVPREAPLDRRRPRPRCHTADRSSLAALGLALDRHPNYPSSSLIIRSCRRAWSSSRATPAAPK